MQIRSLTAAILLAAVPSIALAQSKPVKIGVLNDQSSVYADSQGFGSVIAARLAVEDYAKKLGLTVEIVYADHQNKVDIGAGIARDWYTNQGVDMIIDVPNSSVALAVNTLARDLNKVMIGSGAGTAALTGKACSPNTVHWTYDTWELGNGFARAIFERGGKKWYFISADYFYCVMNFCAATVLRLEHCSKDIAAGFLRERRSAVDAWLRSSSGCDARAVAADPLGR